ncbi:hypothetical protein [Bacillus weihaiensis]|uniref:DUF4025 domain-containing protein n=1 Tax=Bacillus weihaiensis TaxID=1547283 RepID=A0A1L3MPU6_9BACI|nr:hypothetical protein [Bacillus weihaiensis]APH04367.1 hypothetical protein A9C19_06175 [Bacillus weihaiensis]
MGKKENKFNEIRYDEKITQANMQIQEEFYNEKHLEDDIDTSLSMNSNIGSVILLEEPEEQE